MKRVLALTLSLASALAISAGAFAAETKEWTGAKPAPVPNGPFKPTWESLEKYQVPDWYKDGKFGIFIHWGVYSVPAFGSEWYPRMMYQQGSGEFKHQVEKFGPQNKFGYKDFIPMFKAEKFNADQWAALFRKAGAKFVVPVAEHHDGFAMYDSALTKWSAVKMGPKRDIIGELAKAVRKDGMVFGLSSHRAEHWWFMNGGMAFDSDVKDPAYFDLYGPAQPESPPSKAFMDDWLARCQELIDKYQPQLFWFDWWIGQENFKPYLQQFAAYYYNRADEWKKGVAVNYKYGAFPDKAAVLDLERGGLGGIREQFWQTDTAVSKNSWGYIENQDYKKPEQIVYSLIDIVSKNGALLLNIGPKSDGTIPDGDQKILLGIGKWLEVNGEAIYGTRNWNIFCEGPQKIGGGSFSDSAEYQFTAKDFRFTTKPNTVYAIALAWPADGKLLVRSLPKSAAGTVTDVKLLGYKGKFVWSQDENGLAVTLPADKPCEYAYSLKITGKDLKGITPISIIKAPADGDFVLQPDDAVTHGNLVRSQKVNGVSSIGYWDNAKDWVSWTIDFPTAGTYELSSKTASLLGPSGLTFELGDQKLDLKIEKTKGWEDYLPVNIGKIEIKSPGKYELKVRPTDPGKWNAVNIGEITLKRN